IRSISMTRRTRRVIGSSVLLAAMGLAGPAGAQAPNAPTPNFKERSNEVRFQIDFQVPAAALAAMMPKGFTSDVATTGPAKDCNVRVIFIDRVTINGPDNNALGKGTNQFVYLTAPVKDSS